MTEKIHQIFSQDLANGKTGEFGIGESGKAYWNGNPIVTEEKIILQGWVQTAIILTALATMVQALFAGLAYQETRAAKMIAEVNKTSVNLTCIEFATDDDMSVFNSTGVIRAGAKISNKEGPECKGRLLDQL